MGLFPYINVDLDVLIFWGWDHFLCVVSCYLHMQLQTSLKNSTSGRCSYSQRRIRAQNVWACLTDLDLDLDRLISLGWN